MISPKVDPSVALTLLRLFHSSIVPPVNAVQPGMELKPAQRPDASEDASNEPFTSRFAPVAGGVVTGGEVTGGDVTGGEVAASTLKLNADDAELGFRLN